MPENAQSFRLSAPPIREVRFSIFFETSRPLLVTQLGSVYDSWRADFPDVSENAPYQLARESDASKEYSILSDDEPWPMPLMTFRSTQDGKQLLFQADRLALRWEMTPDNESYPGFDVLGRELIDRFRELADKLKGQGVDIEPITAVECKYDNRLNAVSASDFIVGYLNGWSSPPAGATVNNDEYVRFTRHFHAGGDALSPGWLSISGNDLDATDLHVTARRESTEGEGVAQTLSKAHDLALECFRGAVSSAMLRDWN